MHPITVQYANMYRGCIKCREAGLRGAGDAGHRGVGGAGLRGAEAQGYRQYSRVQTIQGMQGTEVYWVQGSGVQGFQRVQGYIGLRVQGMQGSGVQGCRTHECREVRDHRGVWGAESAG